MLSFPLGQVPVSGATDTPDRAATPGRQDGSDTAGRFSAILARLAPGEREIVDDASGQTADDGGIGPEVQEQAPDNPDRQALLEHPGQNAGPESDETGETGETADGADTEPSLVAVLPETKETGPARREAGTQPASAPADRISIPAVSRPGVSPTGPAPRDAPADLRAAAFPAPDEPASGPIRASARLGGLPAAPLRPESDGQTGGPRGLLAATPPPHPGAPDEMPRSGILVSPEAQRPGDVFRFRPISHGAGPDDLSGPSRRVELNLRAPATQLEDGAPAARSDPRRDDVPVQVAVRSVSRTGTNREPPTGSSASAATRSVSVDPVRAAETGPASPPKPQVSLVAEGPETARADRGADPDFRAALEGGPTARPGQSGPPGHAQAAHMPRGPVQQIAAAIQGGPERSFDITLSPAELGKVRITLTPGDAGLSVNILADRPETLDLLRRHVDQLAQDFRDIGYEQAAFSFGSEGGNGAQGRESASPLAEQGIAGPARGSDADRAEVDPLAAASVPAAVGDGRMDIRI